MKTLLYFFGFILITLSVPAQVTQTKSPETRLLVYYFHLTNRCQTCTKIESATRKVLEETFKPELNNQTLIFRSVNVDSVENEALCKKYDAFGATLALTQLEDGKEQIVDMTNFAFAKIHSEAEFAEGLKQKILELLKK